MHFGIIEQTEDGTLRERNCVATLHHGVVPYPEAYSIRNSPSEFNVIYLTGYTPGAVVFDVLLPAPLTGSARESALQFELEQLIPVPLSEVCTGYLKLTKDNRHFRVYAVRRAEIEDLLDKVKEAGLFCDCYFPAQLLEKIDPEGDAETEKLSPGELLQEYLEDDPSGRNLHLSSDAIPVELRPVRHRKWRILFKSLYAVSIVLVIIMLGVRTQQAASEYGMLSREREELRKQLQDAQMNTHALEKDEALQLKLQELQLNKTNALAVLLDLNARLPRTMYLSGYSQSADVIDITIVSSQDDPNLARLLLESKIYEGSIQKTVQVAGKGTVYNVQLRSVRK